METPVPESPQIRLDAAGQIDEDIHCLKCGYNLRGLLMEGLCPECATPVGRSMQGDLLRFCSPEWVETLVSGANWIIVGMIFTFFASILGILAVFLLGASQSVLMLVTLASCLVSLIGTWKITTPNPCKCDQESSLTARKLARITPLILLVLNTTEQYVSDSFPAIGKSLTILIDIAWIVSIFAFFGYEQLLAMRIPSLPLARQTRIVMWGMAVTSMIFLVTSIFELYATTLKPSQAGAPAMSGGQLDSLLIGACASVIGSLIFGIWALVLLFWYRRLFIHAADEARKTWAREPV